MAAIDSDKFLSSDTAARVLYESLAGFNHDDDPDHDLMAFCDSLARPFEVAWGIASSNWASVMDGRTVEAFAIDWLAQFGGVRFDGSEDLAAKRAILAEPPAWMRGTPQAVLDATQRYLEGSRSVLMIERFGGDAYKLFIRTLASQTPDKERVRSAILTQKPAGIVLDYDTVDGQTYLQLKEGFEDYDAVRDYYETYYDLRSDEDPPPAPLGDQILGQSPGIYYPLTEES